MVPENHASSTAGFGASAALEFVLRVERLYAGLICRAADGAEAGLGGKLLYAGELDGEGRALLVAGNIAGAGSLSATADVAAQKQAIRDGVADFLVTSLDEALRILKNEIRKRETVAVCVAAAPEAVEREMRERGVVADLTREDGLRPEKDGQALVSWSVATAPAKWLPKVDALAADLLGGGAGIEIDAKMGAVSDTLRQEHPAGAQAHVDDAAVSARLKSCPFKASGSSAAYEAGAARRWVRLAPRYLGRMAQGIRLMRCEAGAARAFVAAVEQAVKSGEIPVRVQMVVKTSLDGGEESDFALGIPGTSVA